MQTGIREKSEQSTQEEMLCIWEGKPPLALFPHSFILCLLMAEKLDPNEIVTLEELAISSMWEMAVGDCIRCPWRRDY